MSEDSGGAAAKRAGGDTAAEDCRGKAREKLDGWGFRGEAFRDEKFLRLVGILDSLGRVLVAYSGGADSALLLKVARGVLGESAEGVLATSESLDQHELLLARQTAEAMGVPITIVETREYQNPEYRKNDANRCYHCKTELFTVLRKHAAENGIPHVLDGSNADDCDDYRPGLRARNEQGVRSPLLEAGLTKAEVRAFSHALGLPTWDKPAAPCLSSRIPYGTAVTDQKLRQVEAAEEGLRACGFRVVRVRHHGQVGRIEVPAAEFPRLLDPPTASRVIAAVKAAGFLFVALDIEGFRSGSLNAALSPSERSGAAGMVPVETVVRLQGGASR
ncbi:MAG TPA: ATP-dependent sacrificial sulfur transferase LarE [Planctomycetota bacterium]|nr:ATP-dependent sacrificial sulfur transferase LarE [Planctomycetota bacterium]